MFKTNLNNNQGFTLIEMLVATAIGVSLLGAAVYTFTKQQTILRDQNADTAVRAQGRLAINKIAKDMKSAGAGIPINLKFETASSTVFTFKVNPNDGPTAVASNIVDASPTTVIATDVGDYSVGQDVVVYILGEMYDPTPTSPSYVAKVTAIDTATDTLTLDTAATEEYIAYRTVINPYDTITYTYSAANDNIVRTVNGVNFPFIDDVSSMSFVYKDKAEAVLTAPLSVADRMKLRKVELTMSFQDPMVANAKVDLRTDIYVRNTADAS